ncbi:MAG: hypothetical protein ACRC5H_07930 [Treponemataceae bacterium]
MSSIKRIILSLFLSGLVFSGIILFSQSNLYSLIEIKLYQQNIINRVTSQLKIFGSEFELYTENLMLQFSSFITNDALLSVFLPDQIDKDSNTRIQLIGKLTEENYGFLGVRIIEAAGKRIHYSSFRSDILEEKEHQLSYKNYEEEKDISFELVATRQNAQPQIIFDSANEQFIFSYPFVDSYSLYRGSALFYVSVSGLAFFFLSQDLLSIGDSLKIVGQKIGDSKPKTQGIMLQLPKVGANILSDEIQSKWNDKLFGLERLFSSADNTLWVLFSSELVSGTVFGSIYPESYFVLSPSVRIILEIIFCLCVFFIFLGLFTIRQDDLTIINDKIRRFQFSLVEELYRSNEKIDWKMLGEIIKNKRHEMIDSLITESFPQKKIFKYEKDIDILIEKNWIQLLAVIESYLPNLRALEKENEHKNSILIDDIINELMKKNVGRKILARFCMNSPDVKMKVKTTEKSIKTINDLHELENLEDLEELDELDELEEETSLKVKGLLARILKVEPTIRHTTFDIESEELEELEEMEELEELEELTDVEEAEDNSMKIFVDEIAASYYSHEGAENQKKAKSFFEKTLNKKTIDIVKKSYKDKRSFKDFEQHLMDEKQN